MKIRQKLWGIYPIKKNTLWTKLIFSNIFPLFGMLRLLRFLHIKHFTKGGAPKKYFCDRG